MTHTGHGLGAFHEVDIMTSCYMTFTSAKERSVVNDLLAVARLRGYAVSVIDGIAGEGDLVLSQATNMADVKRVLASTDGDTLRFWGPVDATTGKRSKLGTVVLVWGNGEDLIADHTDNEAINTLVEEASA